MLSDWHCSTSRPASSAQPSSAAQPHGRRWPTSSAAYARSNCSTERGLLGGSKPPAPAESREKTPPASMAIRTRTPVDEWVFTSEYALPLLRSHSSVHSLDGVGLGGHETAAIAAGALLHYMQATHAGRPRARRRSSLLRTFFLPRTRRCQRAQSRAGRAALLRRNHPDDTLLHPRRLLHSNGKTPAARHATAPVQRPRPRSKLVSMPSPKPSADLRRREGVRHAMDGVLDLERLLGRVALDSAGPREVVALGATLACLPRPSEAPQDELNSPTLDSRSASRLRYHLKTYTSKITTTIIDEPPVTLADGGVIRAGVDTELDELRELSRSRPSGARRNRRARARAHRHRLAQGPLQQRLRLLHRDHQGELQRRRPPITSASRRWSTPNASPRPS